MIRTTQTVPTVSPLVPACPIAKLLASQASLPLFAANHISHPPKPRKCPLSADLRHGCRRPWEGIG